MSGSGPLTGRRVLTTRHAPGRLDELLAAAGADVIHLPLTEIAEPADGGVELAGALAGLDAFDWVVVTSRHGARRVGDPVAASTVRTAAVGTATAGTLAELTGRPVDLVPARQTAAALVDAFEACTDAAAPQRVLVAQADRAEPTLVDGLRSLGHDVMAVVAYATLLRRPADVELAAALGADAVAFASGSAVRSWVDAVGRRTPAVVGVIGPTTARVAADAGIDVTVVASDHSVEGLVAALVDALAR